MTRTCSRCGVEKPIREFHRWKDDYQWWCKPCRKAYAADHYLRNKERRQRTNKRWQAVFTAWYVSLKQGRPCADCGGVFHHAAMHWDHLPGVEKQGNLSHFCRKGNREAILAEIDKCELVCANCHAVRTFTRRRAA